MTAAPVPPTRTPSLGDRAAVGFVFMTAQMLVSRVTGILGNFILAAILAREHFGLLAMATTVTGLVGVMQQIGVREVLIHRQTSYRVWANAAFWITAAVGLGAGLLIATLAPAAAAFYRQPDLTGILLVLALSTPLANLTIVPETRLQMNLRFRFLAGIALSTALGTTVLSIVLALSGFGAYSFVLPRVIVHAVRCVVLFWAAGFTPRASIQFPRWRYLVGDSGWVFGANLCYTLILSGDSAVIGWLMGKDAAGDYYFAASLSLQAVVLLVTNLGSVLLPALGRLTGQRERQTDALLRSLGVLGMLVVPMCLLQAATAEPLLRFVYQDKWAGAILPLQLLCCGMAMRFLGAPATTLFVAQGRFREFFVLALGSLLFAGLLMTAGVGLIGGVPAIAAAMGVFMIVSEPVSLYLAIRPMGRGWSDVARICLPPTIIAVAGCGLGLLAARAVPAGDYENMERLAVILAVSGITILIGSRLGLRESWNEAADRLETMLGGRPASCKENGARPAHTSP